MKTARTSRAVRCYGTENALYPYAVSAGKADGKDSLKDGRR